MSVSIEDYIDETIRVSRLHGYNPTEFISMRERYRTIPCIKRLLANGDIQSGFKRLCELGLREYTIEAAALKFPDLFSKEELSAAEWRLNQAGT
ncbi:MAG: hypothetical protein LBE54_11900 [Brucellaceae bacterium]|nr:hypothetical protein [Brucellaceae bacterium]